MINIFIVKCFFFILIIYSSINEVLCGKAKKKKEKRTSNKRKIITPRDRINILFNKDVSKEDFNKKDDKIKISNHLINNYNLDVLRKSDKEWDKLQEKRDKRSALDIKKNDLVSSVTIIRKEIILSDNEYLFEKDGIIIEKLFADVKNKKVKIYSDSKLETEMSYEELDKRLIRPVNLESKKRRNEQRKFKFSDIDSLLIEEHLFWVKLYPANILDKMTVTFIIPQSRTGMIEDIVVCYMGYHDFIKFLDNNKIIINNKRMKTTFSNAIDKDKLSFMYKSIISDDRDYSFDMDSYDKNNYACNRIIEEIKENHFSNNYF